MPLVHLSQIAHAAPAMVATASMVTATIALVNMDRECSSPLAGAAETEPVVIVDEAVSATLQPGVEPFARMAAGTLAKIGIEKSSFLVALASTPC